MIEVYGYSFSLEDPLVIAALVVAGVVLLFFLLLILAVRAAGKTAKMTGPMSQQLHMGQEKLRGGLHSKPNA